MMTGKFPEPGCSLSLSISPNNPFISFILSSGGEAGPATAGGGPCVGAGCSGETGVSAAHVSSSCQPIGLAFWGSLISHLSCREKFQTATASPSSKNAIRPNEEL